MQDDRAPVAKDRAAAPHEALRTAAAANRRLRRARPDEAASLSRLAFAAKAHWGYGRDFMEACRKELTVEPETVAEQILSVCDGPSGVVGFYGFAVDGPTGEVTFFFVAPAHLGKGHGRALWRDLVRTARGAGAATLVIDSDPNAAGFYRAMGCRRSGWSVSASIPGRRLPRLEYELGG